MGAAILPSSCSPGTGARGRWHSWGDTRGQQPREPHFSKGSFPCWGWGSRKSPGAFPSRMRREITPQAAPSVLLAAGSPPGSSPQVFPVSLPTSLCTRRSPFPAGHLLGTQGSPLPSAGHGWHPTAPHPLSPRAGMIPPLLPAGSGAFSTPLQTPAELPQPPGGAEQSSPSPLESPARFSFWLSFPAKTPEPQAEPISSRNLALGSLGRITPGCRN